MNEGTLLAIHDGASTSASHVLCYGIGGKLPLAMYVSAEAQWEMRANDPNPLCLPFLIGV